MVPEPSSFAKASEDRSLKQMPIEEPALRSFSEGGPCSLYEGYELVSRVLARHPGKKLGVRRGRVESQAEAPGDEDRVLNGACVPVYEHGPWDVAATPLVTRLA